MSHAFSFRRLLARLLGAASAPRRGANAGKRYRLRLEQLENRLVPTTTLSVADASVVEPTAQGTANMTFTVTRAGDLTSQLSVGYTTVAGTAMPTRDFTPATGTTTFAPGSATATISVPIFGNGVYDNPSLTFSVQLTGITSVVGGVANFANHADFTVGSSPFSLAVADINGDGKPDLIVANAGTHANPGNTVSVLLNTTPAGATTPSFAPQQTFATGARPVFVAVGDFNGDGKPDLVVANQGNVASPGNTVSVLLNTTPTAGTTASFAPQQTFATGALPFNVAVADLNGDGKPDLIVANAGSSQNPGNTVSVLLNTTTGGTTASFAPQQTFATGSVPQAVAVADLNGDGKPDLVTANYNDSTVSVLLNTTTTGASTASFAPQQTFVTGAGDGYVVVGDLNGDGKPDIATANYGANSVSVLVNTTTAGSTTATFAPPQAFATGADPYSLASADINGDGKPDLVVANAGTTGSPGNTVSVLVNTLPVTGPMASFAPQQTFATGTRPVFVAVKDLNGDGFPDLVAANYAVNSVSVLLNDPATITRSTAIGIITESDPQPTVQFAVASETLSASAGSFSFTITQSAASDVATSIPFALGGTARTGIDYSGVSASPLIIPAGQTTGTITGTLISDPGSSQTLTFTLGTPSNASLGSPAVNTLTITEAVPSAPTLTSLSPTSAPAGSPTITITATGTNFVRGSTVDFNGTPLTTTFVSPMQLTATIPASDLTTATTDPITVATPAPGGGTSAPQTFTIINPVLTVQGTTSNDIFSFTASSPHSYTLNGVSHTVSPLVNTIQFVGISGDSAILAGLGGDYAALNPTYVSLTGTGYVVSAANCSNVTVYSSGNATADFGITATGADTFKGTPTFSEALLPGVYNNTVAGFAHTHGFAKGNLNASVILATSAGADTFGGVPAYSFVQGPNDSYDSYAIGFTKVFGYGESSSAIAYLGMTSANDTFSGVPAYSLIQGANYYIFASGFHQVQGYAGGNANSIAYLATSTGNGDVYEATSSFSEVQGTNYLIYALGFPKVQAYYGGGTHQIAYLQKFLGTDYYFSAPGSYSESKGSGYDNLAIDFAVVAASTLHP